VEGARKHGILPLLYPRLIENHESIPPDALLQAKREFERNAFHCMTNAEELLQVLGAYGFRGLFERKAHFLTSIPLALRNFKWFLYNKQVGIVMPEFERLLGLMVEEEVIHRFEPLRANDQTPLVVHINSFSYRKGIPPDPSGNGGGFVKGLELLSGYFFGTIPVVRDNFSIVVLAIIAISLMPMVVQFVRARRASPA